MHPPDGLVCEFDITGKANAQEADDDEAEEYGAVAGILCFKGEVTDAAFVVDGKQAVEQLAFTAARTAAL